MSKPPVLGDDGAALPDVSPEGAVTGVRASTPVRDEGSTAELAEPGMPADSTGPDDREEAPRSPVVETSLAVAIAAAKAATVACAVYALRHADSPQLRGKGIRTRAVGYVGGLLLVPAIWSLIPNRGRYPRTLDLAVTIPLLLDAGGNALGKYQEAHVDDLVHIANAAIVSGVVGALAAPNVDERWQAAGIGAGVAVAGATTWELIEYGALQLGADGMDLTYEDTMADLAEGLLGAALGALFTLTRVPRSKAERDRDGWREPLGLRRRKAR